MKQLQEMITTMKKLTKTFVRSTKEVRKLGFALDSMKWAPVRAVITSQRHRRHK